MKLKATIIMMLMASMMVFAGGKQDKSEGDQSLSYILEKGSLTLGLDDSFPPMGYRDDNGKVVGFDIDLAKEMTMRMGVDLKIQPIDWDAKILDLNSGDIDVIWNGLSITDERMEKIEFSKPYIANRQILIIKAGSGIDLKADLAGKTVGVQLGSSADDAVQSDAPTFDSLEELVKYQDNVQALMDLAVGRIDAVVVDEILGRYYISKKEGVYEVASDYFSEEEYGIGIRKGDMALKNEIDRVIDEMVADGTAAAISEKWFAEDILLAR